MSWVLTVPHTVPSPPEETLAWGKERIQGVHREAAWPGWYR